MLLDPHQGLCEGVLPRYAILGEKDLAIQWLTKAVDERDNTATWAKVQVDFDPIRDDPRFHDLLRRMNLEP